MRSKTSDRPDQRVAPAQEFPSEESFQTVVQDLVSRRDGHHGRCRFHEAEARRFGAEIDAKARKMEALRQEIDHLTSKKNQEEHYAGQERNSCQGFEVTLARIGAQVPPPADPPAQPQTPQGDFSAHAAQFGGPPSFADDSPHGPCLNCGKPAWRKPVSPHHPQGATHSFGATCDPEAEEPTYADLGTREPLGFREAALQRPYVDPTPTGAHPLAQPEERPR